MREEHLKKCHTLSHVICTEQIIKLTLSMLKDEIKLITRAVHVVLFVFEKKIVKNNKNKLTLTHVYNIICLLYIYCCDKENILFRLGTVVETIL